MKVNGEAIHGTGPTPFGAEAGSFDLVKRHKKGLPKQIIPTDSPDYQNAEPLFNPTMGLALHDQARETLTSTSSSGRRTGNSKSLP